MNMRHTLRGLVPILPCLLVLGCAGPGVQMLRWDNATAQGFVHQTPVVYRRVNIDVENIGQNFRIRMPGGETLQTSEITAEAVRPYAVGPNALPDRLSPSHGRFIDVLFPATVWKSAGGYSFEFENGRLVGLGIGVLDSSAPVTSRPAIGKSPGAALYTLPLTEDQLVELFGPYRGKGEPSAPDSP